MRIAVDLTSWSNRRGFGRFTRGLVGALLVGSPDHDFLLFVDSSLPPIDLPPGGRIVSLPGGAAEGSGRRSLALLRSLRRAVAAERFDLLFFPTLLSYFPPPRDCRVVVGLHDVIAEDHPHLVFPRRLERWSWAIKSRAARRRADAVLTVSNFARDGLIRRFGLPPESLWVVEEAADPVFRPLADSEVDSELLGRWNLLDGEPTIAYLGGLNPHKNVPTLVSAIAELRRRPALARLRLLLVTDLSDPFTPGRDEVDARIAELGVRDAVTVLGNLDDADVAQVLNAVDVLALPSFAEGFGLPAVEAAACGTPVVATRQSPLPELLAGGGLFIDPQRPDELAASLARLLEDPALRRELGAVAHRRAAKLSWERSANQFRSHLARWASA